MKGQRLQCAYRVETLRTVPVTITAKRKAFSFLLRLITDKHIIDSKSEHQKNGHIPEELISNQDHYIIVMPLIHYNLFQINSNQLQMEPTLNTCMNSALIHKK